MLCPLCCSELDMSVQHWPHKDDTYYYQCRAQDCPWHEITYSFGGTIIFAAADSEDDLIAFRVFNNALLTLLQHHPCVLWTEDVERIGDGIAVGYVKIRHSLATPPAVVLRDLQSDFDQLQGVAAHLYEMYDAEPC